MNIKKHKFDYRETQKNARACIPFIIVRMLSLILLFLNSFFRTMKRGKEGGSAVQPREMKIKIIAETKLTNIVSEDDMCVINCLILCDTNSVLVF